MFVSRCLPDLSRSQVQRSIRLSLVTVDGVTAWKTGIELKAGQEVVFVEAPREPVLATPEPIPLDVLYEDEHMLAVNKPHGMVVHPAAGHPSGTLVNALLGRCPELAGMGPLRPGIVHRLDRGTSGVMVVARSEKGREGLAVQFLERSLFKGYVALVLGSLPGESGCVDRPIGRHPRDRKRFSSRVTEGRSAVTEWRGVAASGPYCVAALRIRTGRTHQIRVHLSDSGCPVAGDDLYDPGWAGRVGPASAALLSQGPMLHSALLCLRHPVTRKPMALSAPIPDRMRGALEALLPGAVDLVPRLPDVHFFPGGSQWATNG